MDDLAPSDLKTILHSKRANLYYLQHCRVLVNGGRVEYVTDEGSKSRYWNIPIANTTSILLGTGTSITQAAMRELAKAGVLVGFCGGGGTPLFSANEVDVDVAWLTPQSEYRPTEYLQHWVHFWFDDDKRLEAARRFQLARLARIERQWLHSRPLRDAGFTVSPDRLTGALAQHREEIGQAPNQHHRAVNAGSTADQSTIQARRSGRGLRRFYPCQARHRHRPGQPLSRSWQLSGLRPCRYRYLGAGHSSRACRSARQNPPRRAGV